MKKRSSRDMYFELFDQGMDNEQIMKKLAVSKSTVGFYRTQWFAERNRGNSGRTGKEIALAMIRNGITDRFEIAKACGLSPRTVAYYKTMFKEGHLPKQVKHARQDLIREGMSEKEKCYAMFNAGYTALQTTGILGFGYEMVNDFRTLWLKERREKKNTVRMDGDNGSGGNLDKRLCRTCVYQGFVGSELCCDYILIEGHSKGCRAEHCTKYKKKDRRRKQEENNG